MLRIGGLQPLSTIDFPGRLAAVVFLQGCPWRCGYCHNPGLLDADAPAALSWPALLDFLQRRRGLLDGVVFSGGEPSLQAGLPEAVATLRGLGFQVGLHSAGMYPRRLAALLPLLDWVGLDIKAPWSQLDALSGVPGSAARVRDSLARLLERARCAGLAYECRTTWHPALYPEAALQALSGELAGLGVQHWRLQRCRIDGRLAPAPDDAVLSRMAARFSTFELR